MTDKPRKKKPGPKPGSTYIEESERGVNVTIRLPRRQRDKLRKLGNVTQLIRLAVDDKYGA